MVHPTTLTFTSCIVFTVLACASPARGQLPEPWADPYDYPGRVDISVSAGVGTATDWSDFVLLGSISSAFGIVEQVLVRDLRVQPDTQLGAAVTYWRGRYGVRVQASRAKSTLVVGGTLAAPPAALVADRSASIDIDTWSYDLRGVVNLIEYDRRGWIFPYAWVGMGGITYDLAQSVGPPLRFIDHPRPIGPEELVVLDRRSREFLLSVDEVAQETVFAINVGIGTDVRLPLGPGGIGLRVEVSDHVAPSPVGLRITELGRNSLLTSGVGSHWVHHLRATAGFVVFIRR
jgi:hypothetical protein